MICWYGALSYKKRLSLAQWAYVLMQRRLKQLELTEQTDRLKLAWHQRLAAGELPLTIGGGIGQSPVVMLLLQADHIAQVHAVYGNPASKNTLIRI